MACPPRQAWESSGWRRHKSGDSPIPGWVHENLVSPASQSVRVCFAGRDEKAHLVPIAPPKAPRLREALGLQRCAQGGQMSTGDFRLTFEVAWCAELHA